MFKFFHGLRHSLVLKLIVTVGITLLVSIATWAYFNITYQTERLKWEMSTGADRLSNTIKLGTHYSMMLNSRDEITQIINNIAKRGDIENIRIYNKEGEIKFSNRWMRSKAAPISRPRPATFVIAANRRWKTWD